MAGRNYFLVQGDEAQFLNWEEYGCKLHFQQGTISPSDTCEVVAQALVGGNFQFPDGTELISAVYAISCARNLQKPVKVEIQHCVTLQNTQQFKYLSFVQTPLKQSVPPYHFQIIDGGGFSIDSSYGTITSSLSCQLAIVLYKHCIFDDDMDSSSYSNEGVYVVKYPGKFK